MKNYTKDFTLLFLLAVSIFFTSCAPKSWEYAQNEYAQGNNEEAIKWAARTLKEKPNYKEAVVFLSDILPHTYGDLFHLAQSAEVRKDWDDAVNQYRVIESISNIVRTIPPQIDEDTKIEINFETKDVSSELENSIRKATEMHYNTAVRYENSSRSKAAAKEYTKALEYTPNYKDASQRYERMRAAAVQRVAIMKFENKSGKEYFGEVGENITDQAISYAMSSRGNMEFLEFVTRDRIDELMSEKRLGQIGVTSAVNAGKVLGINSFVFGRVNTISINQPRETSARYEQSRKVYRYKKKSYTARALVTVTTRKASVTIKCSYKIVNAVSGKVQKSKVLRATERVVIEFGEFQGDVNALSSEYRNLCSNKKEYPPSEDVLVERASEKLARKLASELVSYFN